MMGAPTTRARAPIDTIVKDMDVRVIWKMLIIRPRTRSGELARSRVWLSTTCAVCVNPTGTRSARETKRHDAYSKADNRNQQKNALVLVVPQQCEEYQSQYRPDPYG